MVGFVLEPTDPSRARQQYLLLELKTTSILELSDPDPDLSDPTHWHNTPLRAAGICARR